jgi:hypothetical protein
MQKAQDSKKIIDQLFASELQFRLASAVRLATTMKKQQLDLPMEWVHGKHTSGDQRGQAA